MSDATAGVELGHIPASAPGAAKRLLVLARARRRPLELVLAFAIYLGFACYFTWPLVTNLAHIFYGASGDPYGTMAFYRELVAHHLNPFLPGNISQFNAPQGQPIPWTRDLASMPGVLTEYLLTAAFGPTPANGLYALMGYTLTGVVTFAFVRHLTGNVWAALIAGWAFAFYPYAILNGQGHDDNIQGWVLVLGIWRMVELMNRPSRRNAILAGLAVVFGMWWDPYFILLGGVSYVAAAVACLAVAWRAGRLRSVLGSQAITAAIVVVFLGFLGLLSTGPAGNSIGVRTNGVEQLNTYSARPLEYLLPDAQSPLFGADTTHYLETHIHGSNPSEATLYVGITTILLSLVAFWAFVRRKLTPSLGGAVLLLSLVVAAAFITSAPPEGRLLGVLIPFPSHFISEITSTWRVYARFVIVVMLGLSALAGIGLHALTRGRVWWVQVTILLCASVAVPLDLWGRLAGRTNTIVTPRVYAALAREPFGLTAQYPLTPNGYNPYDELFFQNAGGKPLINGYPEGTAEERRALSLANLSEPTTAPRLATLGVRYIVVESTPPGYGLAPPGKPGRGFKLLFEEPYANLYAVTAKPSSPALAADGEGFSVNETTPLGNFSWLVQPSGTIELAGGCAHCNGVLTMTLIPFARPRTVVVSTASGQVLARRLVAGPTRVSVPLEFSRHASVVLAATPGPQSIVETIGGSDPRSVSVQVGDLEFTRSAGGAKVRGS
jgi:hypothetical protein